jgi:AraC-like DNA-binding protein
MNVFMAKLIAVGHLAPKPDWRMEAHYHAFHEMIVLIRGRMLVCVAGRTTPAAAGDVLLYPATVPHAEKADPADPVESFFFGFTLDELRADTVIRRHDDGARIRQIIRWMHEDLKTAHPPARQEREALTHALLAEFFRPETHRSGHGMVDKVRRYVREHAAESLTLDALAREAGLSKYHFLRTYRRLTGRTPMADVRAIRADIARDLIQTTSLPIKAVAPTAGLGDEYSMSRVFSKLFGMPPGKFRRHPGR